MSISIERYVSITSGVPGASAVATRELVGLRFTSDPRVPVNAVITVDKTGTADLLGSASPEAVFASQYFGYVSPAPASTPKSLRFAAYVPLARAPRIFGAKKAFTLAQFTPVTNGAIALTLGDTTTTLTGINLAAVTTLADVASALQTAIRANTAGGTQWTGATVTYDATAAQFLVTGGTPAAAAVNAVAPVSGTDLAALLGLSDATAIDSPGSAAQTPLQALQAAEKVTDSFGSLSFGATLALADVIPLSQYVASLNVKYQFYASVTLANAASFSAALIGFAGTGLILNAKAGEYKEALPAAIMAATNYQRRNATVNYMFRQGLYSSPYDVSDDTVANTLDPLRVNYYGETASAGQKLAFFQRGYLMGGATAPLDMNVYANEQWLKSYLQAALLNLEITLGEIAANDEGRGSILAQVVDGVTQGKLNGTISVGKELSTAQQIAVTDLSGDPDAWRDVQTQGWWADVTIAQRTGPSGVSEYYAIYTLAYSKNDVVRFIDGSHNLI